MVSLRDTGDKFNMSKTKSFVERYRFGTSFSRQVVNQIDNVRGDTNRSLWLERLAVKELEQYHSGESNGRNKNQTRRK